MRTAESLMRELRRDALRCDCFLTDGLIERVESLGGPLTDADLAVIREVAYRRGYCQGVWVTYDAFLRGVPLRAIYRWWLRLQTVWRYRARRGRFEQPPDPPEGSGVGPWELVSVASRGGRVRSDCL